MTAERVVFRNERYENDERIFVEVTLIVSTTPLYLSASICNPGEILYDYSRVPMVVRPCLYRDLHAVDIQIAAIDGVMAASKALQLVRHFEIHRIFLTNYGPTPQDISLTAAGAVYKAFGLEPDMTLALLVGG